ncbi:hypothetical protein [Oceanibaculum nanhaiense]|uniref:hypothetical protein n=1 Tax=Oceanibaculum nanhaiense TaxID=1909734 RepID=UPI000A3D250B|nr:hypothetical protein [Oceanibaculum nanhaiense]
MMSTIQNFVAGPFGQSAFFPFIAALLVALVMRLAGGPGRGALLAGVGIPVGWLVCYWLTFGLPPFLPPAALPKLAHVGIAAAVLGFLLDTRPVKRSTALAVAVLGLAGVLVWLGWSPLLRTPLGTGIALALCWALGGIALWRLTLVAEDGAVAAAKLLAAGFGLALVVTLTGSAAYGQMAGGMAAAIAGYFVLAWLAFSSPFGAAALFAGVVLMALAGMAALFGNANPIALALLVLCFFGDPLAARLRFGSGGVAKLLVPVMHGLAALLPVAAAVLVSLLLGGGLPY